MLRKFILSIVFCFLTLGAFLRSAGALESIVIAYPTTSSQFTPLWFARDVGLYEKYGLDGQLVFIQGGSILLQAMLAGQAHAAQNGIAETMVAVLRGGDVKILGVTSNIFPYTLIAAKNAKGPKDLVGGRIAVNRLGDVSAIASRVALRKLGLNPDKDVTMLQVGGSPQRLAALQSGAVQGAALDFHVGPQTLQAGLYRARRSELELSLFGTGGVGKIFTRKARHRRGIPESICRKHRSL